MHHTVIIDLCSCNDFSTNSEQTYKLMVTTNQNSPYLCGTTNETHPISEGRQIDLLVFDGKQFDSLVLQIINNYRFMHPY